MSDGLLLALARAYSPGLNHEAPHRDRLDFCARVNGC
jgi:hypothetical protein